jgi:type IV pilus assembly protein PilB
MDKPKIRIGDLLVEAKLITESQLMGALEVQKNSGGKKIGWILVDLEIVSEEHLNEVLSKKLNTELVKLSSAQVTSQLLSFVPEKIAKEKTIFPYKHAGNTLYIATTDPLDYNLFSELSVTTGRTIEPVIATRADIEISINKYYNKQSIDTIASTLSETATASKALAQYTNVDFDEIEDRVGEVPVVKFINNLILQAHGKRASDIHIEPLIDSLRVRFRIDGELVEIVRMNLKTHPSIITRIKILAGMDIAEKRIPLDGRFSLTINEGELSIRAASMPTIYGEKVALRLMADDKHGIIPLESLGVNEAHAKLMRSAIKTPNGLILVTGPTGSGKSTTLYSLLNELSEVSSNVLTVEDPVEKVVPGVNQTQVNPKAGLSFASGLRAILRQDPDKIMIGEIRDSETADIAARAAITGHLVLASMHTSSAAAAFMRIVDMGIEPYIVASSMISVIAQRLVRLICPHCKETYVPTQADSNFLETLGVPENPSLYKGKGCEYCEYTGNLGRTSVMEIVNNDHNIRELVVNKAKTNDIEEYLTKEREQKYLLHNALDLVLEGKIYIRELLHLAQSLEY